MTLQEVIDRLNKPSVAVEQLLDEARGPDLSLWQAHPELYPAFVKRLLEQGHNGRALELAREGEPHLQDNSRLQYLLALASARYGSVRYAETLLAPLLARATSTTGARPADMDTALLVDVIALRGRLFKDRSDREPKLAVEAARWYELAATAAGATEARAFPLINAATMWRIAGDKAKSDALATEVVELTEQRAEAAAAAGDMWPAASLGEALLLLEQHDKAVLWYKRAFDVATRLGQIGNLFTMRKNIRRLEAVGATADPAFLDEHLGRVVVFSGHLIDSPERLADGLPPRFPKHPEFVAAVDRAIRARLDELNATVGFCSLGCGGDMLFAEAMLDRGAELHVVLPFSQNDFRRTSVDFGQDGAEWRGWRVKFDNLLDRIKRTPNAHVQQVTQEPYLGSVELFGLANTVLQGMGVLRSRDRASEPTGLVLLDRSSGEQAGGTADFLAAWLAAGYKAHEIDLSALLTANPTGALARDTPAYPVPTSTLPRRVKTMLFADIAGYSAIPEWQLPAFLTAYRNYLRALFGPGVGEAAVYANTWGDGLYVVFDCAVKAAEFAVELVEPTAGGAPRWTDFRLGPTNPFRVALHTGPVFELEDLFKGRSEFAGQHVNRTARIEPVTVRGCVFASAPVAALLTMQARGRFTVEAVGVHSLAKNYDRCPLYQVQRGA